MLMTVHADIYPATQSIRKYITNTLIVSIPRELIVAQRLGVGCASSHQAIFVGLVGPESLAEHFLSSLAQS